MNEPTRPATPGDSTPEQVSGAVRLGAAVVIALIALGITVLAVRWLPGKVAVWPWSQ
jgi:uncharacterized membrane protein YfbV (UPF0208 family)